MSEEDRSESKPDGSDTDGKPKRRRILQLAGAASIGALAGCLQFDDPPEEEPARDPDWCVEENDVEVAEVLRTAESIDGIERDPDDLSGRAEAAYQCHPQGYQLCANCEYFIPGKPAETGDGVGACAIVEGRVRSVDWCALYAPTERLAEFPSPTPFEEPGPTKPPDRN